MIQTALNLCLCGCDSVMPVRVDQTSADTHACLTLRCPACQLRRGVVVPAVQAEYYLATVSEQVDEIIAGIDFVYSDQFDAARAELESIDDEDELEDDEVDADADEYEPWADVAGLAGRDSIFTWVGWDQ